jgi:citrate synthase
MNCPVQELCRSHSFEEVAYLLWHGELPTREQIFAQNRAERAQRALGPHVAAALAGQSPAAHPVDTLLAAVSALDAGDPAGHDRTPAVARAKALRLFAVLPSIVAADQRRRHGLGAVAPRDHLGYAANFLCMTFGKVPEPQVVAAFETSLILYADHRLSTSAFTDPAAGAPSDFYTAVAAVIGTLKGTQHGDNTKAVLEMMNEIAIPDNARPWMAEAVADGRRIPGFGHRLDREGDARVPAMRAALGMIAALRRGQHLIEVYEALATAMYEAHRVLPSLDYPLAPAYHIIGFDPQAFTPILTVARMPAWTAQIAGQVTPGDVLPLACKP